MTDHYIICGMGHVGHRCVQLLCRMGERVTVVTQDTRAEWRREAESCGVRVLIGDARDERMLVEANIAHARALLAVTDNDIANIETLLDARRVRPDIPVVIRMFDQTLAQELESTFDVQRAVGTSVLAAPTFAAAALGGQVVGTFAAEADLFVIGHPTLDGGSPLAGRTVEDVQRRFALTVLACGPADAPETPAPGPDVRLQPGGRAVVAGTRSAWRRLEERAARPARAGGRRRPSRTPRAPDIVGWFRGADVAWRSVPLTLRALLFAFLALAVVSYLVFRAGLGLLPIDALYFTVSLLAAAEQGDVTLRDAAPSLKLYAALMMVLGSAVVAVLYAIITDLVVTARFQQLLGRRRIPQHDHVIVAGIGNVGFRVLRELRRAGVPVVAVDMDPQGRFMDTIRAKTPVVFGDARLHHTLRKAGGAHARAVVAVTHDDAVNLGIALAAREVCPEARTVVRLFDAAFADKVQSALNVDAAISTSLRAAPTFVAAALCPGVRTAFLVADRLFMVVQRTAGDWEGQTPASLRAAAEGVVLARSGMKEGSPDPDAPLHRTERVLAVVWRDTLTTS